MAKLRHIANSVPDTFNAFSFYVRAFVMQKVGETDWENARGALPERRHDQHGVLLHYKTEEAAGKRGRDFVGVRRFGLWSTTWRRP